jgi:hypothetical protein
MQSLGQIFIILIYQNELGPDGSTSISLPETRLKTLAFPFALFPLKTAELQTCIRRPNFCTQINLLHNREQKLSHLKQVFHPVTCSCLCTRTGRTRGCDRENLESRNRKIHYFHWVYDFPLVMQLIQHRIILYAIRIAQVWKHRKIEDSTW